MDNQQSRVPGLSVDAVLEKMGRAGATPAAKYSAPSGVAGTNDGLMGDLVEMQAQLMAQMKSIQDSLQASADRLLGLEPPRDGQPLPAFPPLRCSEGSYGFIANRFYDMQAMLTEIGYQTIRLAKV